MKHPSPTIGFIGLGTMGCEMVKRLLTAGYAVRCWARNPEQAQFRLGQPTEWADSVATLASGCDIICTNVTRTDDVLEVLFGETHAGGVAEFAKAGTLVIDFSTIDAKQTADIAKRLASKGIEHLDCPVSGGPMGAKNGTLSIMVGGNEATFKQALPIFQHLGQTIRHVGPSGAGQAIKAANQIALCVQLVGIAEAFNYAKAQGAALKDVLEVLQAGLAGSRVLDWAGPHMVEGFTRPASIEARLHAKDLDMIASEARHQGLNLPLTQKTAELLAELIAIGPQSQDTARIFNVVQAHLKTI